jgi:hypothetical protein
MTPASYLAFLPQHTPGQHHVLAVADHGGGAELCAVASFAEAPSATTLADALNGVLSRQVAAGQRLDAALEGAPEPVRAAVARLVNPSRCGRNGRRPGKGLSGFAVRLRLGPLAGRFVPGQGLRGPPGHAIPPQPR